MKAMFPKTSDLALDLLEKLLAFNPVKRITVEEALRHPYLEPYHDPEDEPTADAIPEEFFDFDKNKETLTKEELKSEFMILDNFCGQPLTSKSSYLQRDYAVNNLCLMEARRKSYPNFPNLRNLVIDEMKPYVWSVTIKELSAT